MGYVYLAGAIIAEVIGTSALKSAEGMTRLWPTVLVILSYATAFYLLSLTLRTIPVGIAYAVWSGIGIILISAIGVVLYKQHLDFAAIAGMGLIIAGVAVIQVFSRSVVA